MTPADSTFWRKCSLCKKEIPFGAKYFACSVSTCKHPRTGFQFCSVECWDGHLGIVHHREAWAEEAIAPARADDADQPVLERRPPIKMMIEKKIMEPKATEGRLEAGISAPAQPAGELGTLVVVTRIKQLIRDRSGFNTSQDCIDALSGHVVELCMKGIESARADRRKTVMSRDIKGS